MITFEITCPHCNNTLNITEEAHGKQITCRHCLNRLIPDLGIEPQPQTPPQPQMPPQTPPQPAPQPQMPPQPQTQSWTPKFSEPPQTPQKKIFPILSEKIFKVSPQREDVDFVEPLLCKIFYYLKLINGIAAAISAFATVVCIMTVEPEVVVAGITLVVSGINVLLYHAAQEYVYRSLRYKWETANNTANIVRLLQDKKP